MKIASLFTAACVAVAMTSTASAQELTTNGGFETGDTSGWADFTGLPSTFTAVTDGTAFEGNTFGRIDNNALASGQVVKQANIGVGQVNPGDILDVSFAARGTFVDGGVAIAEFFSEIDPSGTSKSEILGGGPFFFSTEDDWQVFNFQVTAGTDVSGGVTLQFVAATGGAGTSEAILDIDAASVVLIPEPASLALLASGGLVALVRRRKA